MRGSGITLKPLNDIPACKNTDACINYHAPLHIPDIRKNVDGIVCLKVNILSEVMECQSPGGLLMQVSCYNIEHKLGIIDVMYKHLGHYNIPVTYHRQY